MKILYDHQAFYYTSYSGIPRYFAKLIAHLRDDNMSEVVITDGYCLNRDYQALFPKLHGSISWRLYDKLIGSSINRLNINPSKKITSTFKRDVSAIRDGNYDVFHPTATDPYFLSHLHGKPFVLTIHDLTQELLPNWALTAPMPRDLGTLLSHTTRFIADSHSTKKLFTTYYDVDDDQVDVVYLGPTFNRDDVAKVDCNHPLHQSTKRYILFVNNRFGRKNVYSLLSILKTIILENDLDVVCAGGGEFTRDEKLFFKNLGIIQNMYQYSVTDEQLISLYKSASLFIFPSLNEGFGIPILEAFACGCPTICSNMTSLPEIGGDACLYFDVNSINSIRDTVSTVLSDEKLSEAMILRGFKQLELFSWKKCVEETKKVYEKCI